MGAGVALSLGILDRFGEFPQIEASAEGAVRADTPTVAQSEATVVEYRSGCSVPAWIQIPASVKRESAQELIGTSIRTVTILGFLTYTLAVYADPIDLSRCWRNATPAPLSYGNVVSQPDDALARLVSEAERTRTVRIINYRKIDASHFCQSLSSGLSERVRRSGREFPDLQPKIAEFRSLFKVKELPPGTTVDFAFREGNTRIFVNGSEIGSIFGTHWEREFLGMFLGEHARAESMRSDIAKALATKFSSPSAQ